MSKQLRSGLLFTILAAFASGCAYLNGNYKAVEPGVFYRSGQMNEAAFRRRLAENGARTVISLREAAPGKAWFEGERAAVADLGVTHYILDWDKDRLPTPDELTVYIRLLEESEKPVWVHCQGGVHRTSVASAMLRLLEGESPEAARQELILGFGRPTIGKLLEWYGDGGKPFADWVAEDYPRLYQEHPEWHHAD